MEVIENYFILMEYLADKSYLGFFFLVIFIIHEDIENPFYGKILELFNSSNQGFLLLKAQ